MQQQRYSKRRISRITFLHTSIVVLLICLFSCQYTACQKWLLPSDTISPKRQIIAAAGTGLAYTAFSAGLYHVWYSQYDRSQFHLFNDWNEWRNMDKLGHLHSAYAQTSLIYTGARWAGMSKKQALITGVVSSLVFQSTIEVFDGFSAKWGFSVPDMVANLCGTGLFAWQEHLWGDQRFQLRFRPGTAAYSQSIVRAIPPSEAITTPRERASLLYGNHWAERLLKDYNGQSYWLSVQIKPWLPPGNSWPDWLCLGVGFGAGNLYGGFSNQWMNHGNVFDLSDQYPRYSRVLFGPDISIRKLGMKHPILKTLTSMAQVFRIPMPCLEWNTRGEWVLHLLH